MKSIDEIFLSQVEKWMEKLEETELRTKLYIKGSIVTVSLTVLIKQTCQINLLTILFFYDTCCVLITGWLFVV
jgi:hypothetical protein